MTTSQKRLAIGLLAALLLLLLVLSAALPRLELQPGTLFRLEEEENPSPEAAAFADASAIQRGLLVLRGIVAAVVIIYPIYIILSLLTKEGRKRLFKDLARLAVLILFLLWFTENGSQFIKGFEGGEEQAAGLEIDITPEATVVAFEPVDTSGGALVILVVLAIGLAAIVGAFAWWWFTPEHRKPYPKPTPGQQLAEQAGQAVKEIEAGAELSDVILRCYHQMERTLADNRGLARPDQETPSEFAGELVAQGLPEAPVRQLTRLFEAARYGSLEMNYDSQQAAVKCLTAIQRTVSFGL